MRALGAVVRTGVGAVVGAALVLLAVAGPAAALVAPPAQPAAATRDRIGLVTVLVAAAVLVGAVVIIRSVSRAAAAHPPRRVSVRATPPDLAVLAQFLVRLGEAMIDSGEVVARVAEVLRDVARAAGAPSAEIVVLPTALVVSLDADTTVRGQGLTARTAVGTAGSAHFRLDQVEAVYRVARSAQDGHVSPEVGLATLDAVRTRPAPTSLPVRVVGFATLSVGLALVLHAGWPDVLLAAGLGAVVGGLQVGVPRWGATAEVFVPVLSTFAASTVVLLLAATSTTVYVPLAASLVVLLPGALLTSAVIELATGQMVSGAGRLAGGVMKLVLLAFGIVAAAQVVGVRPDDLGAAPAALGAAGPWLGVGVFGAGALLHHCANRRSWPWVLLALYVAYAGQVVGGLALGGALSAFVGALAMTPVAVFAAAQRSGPPMMVTFLPAFWLLVPGAAGLMGVTQVLGADHVVGFSSLVDAGVTMVSITFGVLLGLGVGSLLTTGWARARPALPGPLSEDPTRGGR